MSHQTMQHVCFCQRLAVWYLLLHIVVMHVMGTAKNPNFTINQIMTHLRYSAFLFSSLYPVCFYGLLPDTNK